VFFKQSAFSNMAVNKLFTFLFLAVVYWFLCGGPDFFAHPSSLALYAIGIAYLSLIMWNDQLFKLFYGDSYTYGGAGMGIALGIGIPAMVITTFMVRFDSNVMSIPGWIGKVGIGFLLLGILTILSVPIFTSNAAGVLPVKESRRWYDDETTTSKDTTDV
jgi:hypothetical protein